MAMKVIVVLAEKGGAGKTTVSQAVAVAAAHDGRRVVLLDTDPQCSASNWDDRRQVELEFPWVVPAVSARLKKHLEDAVAEGIELVVIDTPPEAGADGLAAARLADLVLIPARPHVSDLETLPKVQDMLRMAGGKRGAVVLNDAPVQGKRHESAARGVEAMGLEVADVVFFHRAAHADAPDVGLVALEYAPGTAAAEEQERLYSWVCKAVGLSKSKR